MSQNETVLEHLKRSPLTALEAMMKYRIMRLAARIDDLRDAGHNIITRIVRKNNKRYAEYHLLRGKK